MSRQNHNNPIRGRINSWILDFLNGYMNRKYGPKKRELFSDLPGTIVEIGPGPGSNFRYYPKNSKIIAIEPNRLMYPRLRRNAETYGLNLEIVGEAGEKLSLESQSVDTVVCTLVLCTVENQKQVLAEILRILRKGGRFIFFEHVAASAGSLLSILQRLVKIPWQWCFEGCSLVRHTGHAIETSGFSQVKREEFHLRSIFIPMRPHIAGVAVK